MQANDLRKGMTIIFNKDVHVVLDFKHFTPGNKRAFVQASLKNIKTGKILQNKFSSTEEVEFAPLEPKPVQYLYKDASGYHFMDMEDYHTITLGVETIGDGKYYLKENMELAIRCLEDRPVVVELPKHVSLRVTDSPPWVKGDSVSNNMKPATLETGLQILVPIFIEQGTVIRVDTKTGEYVSRE